MAGDILRIDFGGVMIRVEMLDTPTGRALVAAAPFAGRAQIWGEEVYFATPVSMDAEPTARAELQLGEIAFWPSGDALCLCFGSTPASRGNEPRLASPGNVCGRALDDVKLLASVRAGAAVKVSREQTS